MGDEIGAVGGARGPGAAPALRRGRRRRRGPSAARRPRARRASRLHSARFHLDKLVEEGLLDVDYRRLSGRSGPGCGAPGQALPPLARRGGGLVARARLRPGGRVFAAAVERSLDGATLAETLAEEAREAGRRDGTSYDGKGGELDRSAGVLAGRGLRADPRRRRTGAAQLPVRRARPGAHRAGLRGQPRLRRRRARRARLRPHVGPARPRARPLLRARGGVGRRG